MVLRRRPPYRFGSVEDAEGDGGFAQEALSHVDSLYGTALRLTRRPADAEDLVQDTYLKAFRASDQFERGTNLKAWLFTILHNTYRNTLRHKVRNPVDVDSDVVERAADVVSEDHNPEQLLTRATLDSNLQAALDGLPETFRQAVWLRDVEEFSYAEIANIIGVPIGTVMSRISRGRRLLYERLAEKA
jgi:RNA polymerase sigma-70 factor (ECF subfamily)